MLVQDLLTGIVHAPMARQTADGSQRHVMTSYIAARALRHVLSLILVLHLLCQTSCAAGKAHDASQDMLDTPLCSLQWQAECLHGHAQVDL